MPLRRSLRCRWTVSPFIFSWFLDTVPSSWPSHLRHLPVLLASFDGLAMDSFSPLISNASFNGNGTKINRLAEWAECGMSPQPRWWSVHDPSTDHFLNASIFALHRALLFRWRNHQWAAELSSRSFRICHRYSSHVPFPWRFAWLNWCPRPFHTCEWNA